VLVPACAEPSPKHTPPPDTLRIAFPEGIGGGGRSGAAQVAEALSLEGLTRVASDGRAVKRIADSWEWAEEGLKLRITLRPDVTLHDGRPLTAALAAHILLTIVSDADSQALFTSFADLTAIEPDGEHVVVLTLSRHSYFLPEDLSIPFGIAATPTSLPIGTGPYKVVKKSGSTFELERFDRYYLGRPSIAKVVVTQSKTLRTAWAEFLRGELGMVTDVPPDVVKFVRNDNTQVIPFSRPYQYMIAFNSARPKFAKPAVRRALNLAIDRDAIVNGVLKGSGKPATGPIWPEHWAYDPAVEPFAIDRVEATRLLESVGLTVRASTRPDRPPARLRFTCILPVDFSIYERVSMELQRQLYEIGVDIEFEVLPFNTYSARLRTGDFEAAFVDLISAPSLGRPYTFWRSAGAGRGYNVFGYENPHAEALFQTLRSSTSEIAVRNATHRLQHVFLDDPPAIFLAWNKRSRAVSGEFEASADAEADPLLSLWRWGADKHPGIMAAR
jgi:peptide/nickel transport system substrate-binding protein